MIEIRRFEERDQADVVQLHHLGLDQFDANAGLGPWDDDLKDIPGDYFDAAGEFLVATRQGRVVAMGALRRISEEAAEIKRMRVLPAFQRRGIGEKLLQVLEDRARELEYTRLILDTTVNQGPAQAFYLKHGFSQTGRDLSKPLGLIFFEKHLDSATFRKKTDKNL